MLENRYKQITHCMIKLYQKTIFKKIKGKYRFDLRKELYRIEPESGIFLIRIENLEKNGT